MPVCVCVPPSREKAPRAFQSAPTTSGHPLALTTTVLAHRVCVPSHPSRDTVPRRPPCCRAIQPTRRVTPSPSPSPSFHVRIPACHEAAQEEHPRLLLLRAKNPPELPRLADCPAPSQYVHAPPPARHHLIVTPDATNPPVPASQSGPVHTPANPAPSRRIIFNRKDVVPNSDSDDDDDSLPDLDFNLPPHKSKPLATPTAHIATRSKRTSDNDEDGLRKPTKKLKDDKRKFNSLVRTTQKKLETEREIQERKAVLDEAEQEPATAKVAINEETLGQVLQDDDDGPEKAHRLLQAMQRTNATQMESVFYFFKDTADAVSTHSKFPITAFPQQRWVSAFQNANTRHLAFMTGFAQQIFRTHHLPEELASWMIDQSEHDAMLRLSSLIVVVRYSQSEVLNCKYLEILEVRPHPRPTRASH